MARVNFSTYDRLNKQTSMSVPVNDAIGDVAVQALADALDAIILGVAIKATVTVPNVVDAGALGPSTDQDADRSRKWLFRTFVAAENKTYNNEIGTADNAILPGSGSDFVDLTAGLGLAVKTAWDAEYETPNGNSGVLASIQQVSREET